MQAQEFFARRYGRSRPLAHRTDSRSFCRAAGSGSRCNGESSSNRLPGGMSDFDALIQLPGQIWRKVANHRKGQAGRLEMVSCTHWPK